MFFFLHFPRFFISLFVTSDPIRSKYFFSICFCFYFFSFYLRSGSIMEIIWIIGDWIFSIFYLFLFTFFVLYHGRQVEIASSLDFLWKQQARKELEEMSEMRRHTNQLLQNLLPLHVAKFFLAEERLSEDLFAEARLDNITKSPSTTLKS